jgi:V/A-type H+-transporting ATPase subunit C
MRLEIPLRGAFDMGSVLDFAAINTKVKVLERSFLSTIQIKRLFESKNYKEALFYLKENTNYKDVLNKYNMESVHRGELEIILKKHYAQKYCKLVHYLKGDYKQLLEILYTKLEIEDLKVILRGKFIGKAPEEIEKLMCYRSNLSRIDYDKLIKVKSLEAAVENLKETIYYETIQHLIKTTKEEGLFRVEMALDFVFFSQLRKNIKKLTSENKEFVEAYIGINADLLNIQWIFRGKKYYSLSPEELLNYTIYDGHKLNKDILKSLCYCKNMSEFYGKVDESVYSELFIKSKYEEYLLEREILLYEKGIFERVKKEHKLNISVVIAYLELAAIEMRDIISIVENKRYNNENNEILKYITVTI